LFVGKANSIRYKTVSIHGIKMTQQVSTFSVQESFSGSAAQAITVRSDKPSLCGYKFKKGQSYLVDARGSGAVLFAAACGFTAPTTEAQEAIQLLRMLGEHSPCAVIGPSPSPSPK
jgi:hypothetical protein